MVRESPAYTEHVIHSQDQWYNELIGLQYEVAEPSIPQGYITLMTFRYTVHIRYLN